MSSNNALCLPLTLSPCTVWPVSTHLLLTLLTPAVCTLSPFSHTLYVPVQHEQGSHTFVVNFVHAYGVHSFSFQSLTWCIVQYGQCSQAFVVSLGHTFNVYTFSFQSLSLCTWTVFPQSLLTLYMPTLCTNSVSMQLLLTLCMLCTLSPFSH